MPMLFISYKRGDSSVEPVIEKLKQAKYRIWYDKDSIVTSTSWRDAIHIGIEQSAALVLMVNPEACASPYVKEEVDLAISKSKPIFPVLTRKTDQPDLDNLGISSLQFIDFTVAGSWDKSVERLLHDLKRIGIVVTRHEAIELDPEQRLDRERYLRRMQSKVGFLNLSRVVATQGKVPLERVYIPLPTEMTLNIEVKNFKIVDWWASRRANVTTALPGEVRIKLEPRQLFGTNVEVGPLEAIVGQVQDLIDQGLDSNYNDLSKKPLLLAPPWYDGLKEEFWPILAHDVAAISNRLVLIGPPGCGKTTFVRYLTLCMIGSQLTPPIKDATTSNLGMWPHGSLTPIFIELRQFANWKDFPALNQSLTEDVLWEYFEKEVVGTDMHDVIKDLKYDLSEGRAIILFDGLDEIPIPAGETAMHQRKQQFQDLARELSTVYPNSRIVFTSRDYAYNQWKLEDFTVVRITSLNDKEMHALATNLYRQKGLALTEAKNKADALLKSLVAVPATLKDYPLFVTLMATLFLRDGTEELPTRRGQLYFESIMLLLDRWTQPRLDEPSLADQINCTVQQLYDRLEVVAYKTHQKSEAKEEASSKIEIEILVTELFRMGPGRDIHRILAFLSQQSGVLISTAQDVYQFAHRGFQEFFAASYMANQFLKHLHENPGQDFSLVRDAIETNPQLWREPCLLIGEVLFQKGQKNTIWDLIDPLLEDELTINFPADSPKWWSVWLAGRLVLDQELYVAQGSYRNRSIYNILRQHLKALLNTVGALSPNERADAGRILGLIDDDRPGVGVKNGLPDIDWCIIPKGEFIIGTTPDHISAIQNTEWGSGSSFNREIPDGTLFLPEFHISRYTITQEQFRTFVDAKDGYDERKWWTQTGWDWFQKVGMPPEPEWGYQPNLPRTNVSWFEAMAFCNWLGEKLGCILRLPTEAEWEKAARGIDGRLFPWGNDFSQVKCNTSVSGFARPVAVGCYVINDLAWQENSPLDMSGNLWEWCSTACNKEEPFSYPYDASDGRENLELNEDHFRIVRGGSYLNPPFLVRTAYRGRDKPSYRLARSGFRVVKVV